MAALCQPVSLPVLSRSSVRKMTARAGVYRLLTIFYSRQRVCCTLSQLTGVLPGRIPPGCAGDSACSLTAATS